MKMLKVMLEFTSEFSLSYFVIERYTAIPIILGLHHCIHKPAILMDRPYQLKNVLFLRCWEDMHLTQFILSSFEMERREEGGYTHRISRTLILYPVLSGSTPFIELDLDCLRFKP